MLKSIVAMTVIAEGVAEKVQHSLTCYLLAVVAELKTEVADLGFSGG
jgi:hypothetical protein